MMAVTRRPGAFSANREARQRSLDNLLRTSQWAKVAERLSSSEPLTLNDRRDLASYFTHKPDGERGRNWRIKPYDRVEYLYSLAKTEIQKQHLTVKRLSKIERPQVMQLVVGLVKAAYPKDAKSLRVDHNREPLKRKHPLAKQNAIHRELRTEIDQLPVLVKSINLSPRK